MVVTMNSKGYLGTLEPERINAYERIVESANGTFAVTLQKRKNYCMIVITKMGCKLLISEFPNHYNTISYGKF